MGWNRDQKLLLVSLAVAVLIGLSAFFVPEVRQFFGLDKPVAEKSPRLNPPSQARGAVSVRQNDAPNSASVNAPTDRSVDQKATPELSNPGSDNLSGE